MTPVTGFHSVIDRPLSVSRVAPPTIKVRKIMAAEINSHSRTGRRRDMDASGMLEIACRRRRGPYSPARRPANVHFVSSSAQADDPARQGFVAILKLCDYWMARFRGP